MTPPYFQYLLPALAICLLNGIEYARADDDISFDPDFMNLPFNDEGNNLDINRVLKKKSLMPGNYPVSLSINHQEYGQNDIEFKLKGNTLVPCIPLEILRVAGVKSSVLTAVESAKCIDISEVVKQASVYFDSQKLAVRIIVPQESLDLSAKGYIDPQKWDEGIPALILNYNMSEARNIQHNMASHSSNVYLDGGINLLGFRLRSSATWRKGDAWQSYNTFVEKDLPGTLGSVQAGELFTGGDVLDSVPFRGVQAGSVVQMLPDSLQGFSPVIRGVANTQAKVEISQHGYSLYTTFVPPGPFEIRDLNTASGNGDLDVTITEADGSVRHFTHPFATLGNLLRQGTWRYNIAAGEYKSGIDAYPVEPRFLQISGALGMKHDVTLSTGFTVSDMYQTAVLGLGKSLGNFGALALDVSQSRTCYRERHEAGQSYSLRYGKAFNSGTNLRFAGYRYSTEGYRTFNEAVTERSYVNQHQSAPESRRNRIEGTLSQNIGESSSLYVTANQQTWWHSPHKTRQLQVGFNTSISWVNLGLYASHTSEFYGYSNNPNTEISLMLSLPLGSTSLNSTITRSNDRRYSENIGMSGTAGAKNQFNYNLDLRSQSQANSTDYAISGGYLSPWAQINGGVSTGKNYRSGNIGIAGSLLVHAGGVELSQRLGDTIALVHVDKTPGVSLQNTPTSVTNSRGYALVPYLRPYRSNRILLDTRNVDNRIDIDGQVQQIYPRRGAVVEVHYRATKNLRLLMQLNRPGGSYVPFGASVRDNAGRELTLVGQAGQALINQEKGVSTMALNISWGSKPDQQCHAEVRINGLPQNDGLSMAKATCQ